MGKGVHFAELFSGLSSAAILIFKVGGFPDPNFHFINIINVM